MEENASSTPEASSSSAMKFVVGIVIVLVLTGAAWFFMRSKTASVNQTPVPTTAQTQTMEMSPTEVMPSETASPSGAAMKAGAAEAQAFTVEGGNFYFKPSVITVKKGTQVKITFTNAGGMHKFKIVELNVATSTIASGKSETVTFTPDKAGSYEFYCSVGNHRQMGMKGTLIVQ